MSLSPQVRRRLSRVSDALKRRLPLLAMTATLGFVALLLALVLLVRPANAGARTLADSYDPGSARTLQLNVPFGKVRIEGVERGPVRVRVDVDCRNDHDCDEFVDGLRLASKRRGETLEVKIEGSKRNGDWDLDVFDHGKHGSGGRHRHGDDSDLHVEVVLQVPRTLALDLNVGAGEVEIANLRRDVAIDMGAGELTLRLPEGAVRSIRVDVAIGEVAIHQGGRTREYARVIGGPVRWNDGKGSSEIEVNLGAGEVDVTLD
jgi:hypothetical protein